MGLRARDAVLYDPVTPVDVVGANAIEPELVRCGRRGCPTRRRRIGLDEQDEIVLRIDRGGASSSQHLVGGGVSEHQRFLLGRTRPSTSFPSASCSSTAPASFATSTSPLRLLGRM